MTIDSDLKERSLMAEDIHGWLDARFRQVNSIVKISQFQKINIKYLISKCSLSVTVIYALVSVHGSMLWKFINLLHQPSPP